MAGNIKLYKAGNYIIVEHADNQLTLGTADSDVDVIINRDVRQYNLTTQHLTARAATDSDELEVVTASGEFVIGPINHARLRNSSGSTFGASRDAVVTAMNGSSLFGAALLESRVSLNTSGRTTNASNISTLQSDVNTAETDIANLKKALKFSANDRGVFLDDDKNSTASLLRLQQQEIKLQVGTTGRTNITSTESSPGIHKFFVQAGASGSEATVEALRISGSTTANTKASIETSAGTSIVANSGLTVNGNTTLKALAFSSTGSPHSVSFTNASVSGLAASAVSSGTFSTARIPGLGSSKITSGTLADARISSSSVTQHAGDIDLADLGDVNNTAPTDGQVLTWDNTNSYWKPATVSGGGSGISDVVDDTSPQLGGHLDVNGQEIRSTSNNNITLRPNGTGTVVTTAELTLDYTNPQIKFKGDDNIHYRISIDETNNEVVIGHTTYEGIRMDSYGALTFPNINGSPSGGVTAGYLKVDGSGNVSTDTPTDTNTNVGNTNLSIAATRTLTLSNSGNSFAIKAGSLTPFKITSNGTSPATIAINGDLRVDSGSLSGGLIRLEESPQQGSSYVQLQAPTSLSANLTLKLPATDGTAGQFLKTDGSGNLSFATASGGGSTLTQVFTQSFIDDIATTRHYLPWKDINEQTTIYQEEAAMMMPYDGKIKQVTIRVATQVDNAGNFTVGVYTCPIGTNAFVGSNWTLEESEVLAFDGASLADDHHAFHFVFDDAQHFEAGDLVSISLQASADPGTNSYWYVTTLVEWDTDNGLGTSSTELTVNP